MTSFSELGLSPAIAEAIAAKKFETATRVQAAVMNPELRGRDLLVSSETGSGKTLAFGAVLARELLADETTAATATKGPRVPRALVIAPTRELATQVRGELAWLFAKTGWRLGVFTGGTDVWGDVKALKSGVDVVVGTPGRLVDLVTRGTLSLSTVEAVVLDEADEMLDMGFREDLEKLLGAASGRRLSLLFSATMPEDILRLARRYQKDAARIDTRQSGSAPHADIAYVAYLTAVGEKFPAVMNILRMYDAKRAIVFGTTRDGVARLHEALAQRGVKAVVLSGERSQADRDRALATLKRGEASVLVATNVAARGLDLPEVDLVVHADLPSNVEALTHRSGRTGRAGRKGTSVLVAQITERRKAERLMSMARLQVSWQSPPDAAAVATKAEDRFFTVLGQELGWKGSAEEEAELDDASDGEGATDSAADATATADAEGEPAKAAAPPKKRSAADRVLDERTDAFLARTGDVDREAFLRALLRRELSRLPAGDRLTSVGVPRAGAPRDQSGMQTPTERRAHFAGGTVVFRINIGLRQNAEPGWILPLICRRGGITRKDVGAIRLGPQSTEFEIAGAAAADFALAAQQADPRAPGVYIERADGGGSSRGRAPAEAASLAPRVPRLGKVTPHSRAFPHEEAAPLRSAHAPHAKPRAALHAAKTASEAPAVEAPASEAVVAEPRAEASETPHAEVVASPAMESTDPSSSPEQVEGQAAQEALGEKPRAVKTSVKKPHAAKPREDAPASEDKPHASKAPVARARKPFGDESSGAKPFGAKPFAAKPFGAKPFAREPRSLGDKPYAAKPFAREPRSFGDKPYAAKPFAREPRSFGDKPYAAKPFAREPRSFGDKPFAREPRSFGDKPFAAKPFAREPRSFGDKPYASKSQGDKPFAARPRPAKSFDDKPFAPRPFGAKPFGAKPFAPKPFGEKPARSSFEGTRPTFAKGGDRPLPRSREGAPVRAGAPLKPSRPRPLTKSRPGER